MTLASLRNWAADNFIAATFQTMGQYRTALLRAIDEAIQQTFQLRVKPWMLECFGAEISADAEERNHRFLEEALELVQACGCSRSEAHQLVDYVFSRPVGEKHQEVGGVMVTLAALCLAQSLDMHAAGETELARVWTKVDQIRAKQAAKPKHSPLPQHVPDVYAASRAQDAQPAIQYSDELTPRTPSERSAYLEGVEEGKMRAVRDWLAQSSAQVTPVAFDLVGLADRMLAPRDLTRDERGMLSNPALPELDEGDDVRGFLLAFGIECEAVRMETDCDDEALIEAVWEGASCAPWAPTPPDGDGWMLSDIYDTEDGPVALFIRKKPAEPHKTRRQRQAESQRKRDSDRMDKLIDESWDLRCFDIGSSEGDGDVGWRVVEHHQAAPHERVVAEVFRDDPRAAIDAAISRKHAEVEA
ncbi:hypothetical protein [Cupriavidus pauculus]|uniref:hypothetical protein n=1 Tax=Cupriavidus pauculus TaxID=82633 RepID=UPI001EE33D27|nr:hypothetical protein [Cupriavidus pauculus]GJG92883.1 hypothetical protein CBA19C6_00360 [Cupriavidus pauculus]